MKRFFTLFVFVLSLMAWPSLAQEIDESFVFVDKNGEVIPNGATVVCNEVELFDEVTEVINSGVSVKNMVGSMDYIKMIYEIERIDNGSYQLCFPTSCNYQNEEGIYETANGQLMGDIQDIMSEWFPVADGECIVTVQLELLTKQGGFPPTYIHKAYGPTITLRFVKGGMPEPVKGDVNGDGEVNISDINAVIQAILTVDFSNEAADVNGDGEVNISDINAIIGIILNPTN